MIYNPQTLIPIIHTDQYDDIATSFLEHYYKEGLYTPQRIPILEIARDKIGLDVQFLCIDEDQKIFESRRTSRSRLSAAIQTGSDFAGILQYSRFMEN